MLEAQTATQGDSVGDWLVGHAIDGVDQNISTYDCQVKVGTHIDRAVSVRTGDNLKFIVALSSAETASLPIGAHVISVIVSRTSTGYHQQTNGILTIATATPIPQTEVERITAEIADAKAMRVKVMMGEAVTEVWREGRRVVKPLPTLNELNAYIRVLETELAEATRVAEGKPKRRAIGIAWRN